MRFLYSFFLFISIKISATELIIEYACPERIQTIQKVFDQIDDWRDSALLAFNNDSAKRKDYSEHYLSNVKFSSDPPEERFFLIPDNEHELSEINTTARGILQIQMLYGFHVSIDKPQYTCLKNYHLA